MEPYVEAVRREIDACAYLAAGRRVDSVYLGGGTPSLLPPTSIATLLHHCRKRFAVAPDAEVTLETNPETVTRDRVGAWLDAGVTRVSMGVQSLDERELVTLDRAHTAHRAEAAFKMIRAAGASNISVDLLYGLPDQTVEGWHETVRRALDLGAEHLSAYALIPEPDTPIGSAVAGGSLALPSDDVVVAQEQVLQDAAAQSGLERYEISNYSKPGFECRHNVLYWRCDDWLGFGASAHSHIQGQRWWNRFAPDDYMRGVAGGDPVDGRESLGVDQRVGEALAFGLRMVGGVPRQLVIERFGQDAWTAKGPGLAQLVADGLVAGTRDAIRLTRRGLAFADTAAALLI